MKAFGLEPEGTYRNQVWAQLHWWQEFRGEIVDQLKEATIYEVVTALQEDHKKATSKIDYFTRELEKCDDVLNG